MNVQLQKAVTAVRAGKRTEAHHLLEDILQQEPENVHAWFLLSTVAPSREKQIEHLYQVLALEPDHAGAQKRLAQLGITAGPAGASRPQPADEASPDTTLAATTISRAATESKQPEPLPISSESGDFFAQADADTIPAWLASEETIFNTSSLEKPAGSSEFAAPFANAEELPTWLQDTPAAVSEFGALPGWLQESAFEDRLENRQIDDEAKTRQADAGEPSSQPSSANNHRQALVDTAAGGSVFSTNSLLISLSVLAIILTVAFIISLVMAFQ
jgi:hypothetical protein